MRAYSVKERNVFARSSGMQCALIMSPIVSEFNNFLLANVQGEIDRAIHAR